MRLPTALRRLLPAAALVLAAVNAALGQTNGTWTGTSGTNGNWSTVTNWSKARGKLVNSV